MKKSSNTTKKGLSKASGGVEYRMVVWCTNKGCRRRREEVRESFNMDHWNKWKDNAYVNFDTCPDCGSPRFVGEYECCGW